MMPLGTRVVPEDATLQARIETALNEALDRMVAADFEVSGERGMATWSPVGDCAVCTPSCDLGEPVVRLSVADVARIAAAEAYRWF